MSQAGASFWGVAHVSECTLVSRPVPGVRPERSADGPGASAGEQQPDAGRRQPVGSGLAGQRHRPHHQGVAGK